MFTNRCIHPFLHILFCLFALAVLLLWPHVAEAERIDDQGWATTTTGFAIAYVGQSRDNQQIRLINPDGSNDRLLWQTPANTERQHGIGELSWRSDASEVAFDSGHDWQRSLYLRDIYAVTADGSASRRVTRPPAPSNVGAYPTGAVTFWFNSYASGDVQLYIEGADNKRSRK